MKKSSDVFIEASAIQWEDLGGGIRRKMLGFDPNLMMTYIEFKKGSVGSVHKHHHTQTTYVEKGSFEVQIGGKKRVLAAGDCYFVPSNTEHGVVALEDATLVDVFTPMRDDFLKQDNR
ncbi:MAG TPA: cupin domain-containing protein [Bacteroidota bacterium]